MGVSALSSLPGWTDEAYTYDINGNRLTANAYGQKTQTTIKFFEKTELQ
jgi:YD repeat-containing protein